jgi:hypothetical protein
MRTGSIKILLRASGHFQSITIFYRTGMTSGRKMKARSVEGVLPRYRSRTNALVAADESRAKAGFTIPVINLELCLEAALRLSGPRYHTIKTSSAMGE